MMIGNILQPPPFWPSPRLWLKLLLSSICAPSLVIGVSISLAAVISGGRTVYYFGYEVSGNLIAVLSLAVTFGGPITLGLFLSSSRRRGVGSGFLSVLVVGLITYAYANIASLLNLGRYFIGTSFAMLIMLLALLAGVQIAVLEVVTGDVRGRSGQIGLGSGVITGVLLAIVLARFIDPDGRALSDFFSVPWSAYSALVWLSAALSPELFTRQVGWGGVIVWAGLAALVFGISFVLMK